MVRISNFVPKWRENSKYDNFQFQSSGFFIENILYDHSQKRDEDINGKLFQTFPKGKNSISRKISYIIVIENRTNLLVKNRFHKS